MDNTARSTDTTILGLDATQVEAYVAPCLTQHAPLHALTGMSGCGGGTGLTDVHRHR